MQTYTANFTGGRVWTVNHRISDDECKEVFFTEFLAVPYHLQKFDSKEEPEHIRRILISNWHSSFGNVHPIFEVGGTKQYYLACEKLGIPLEKFLESEDMKRRLVLDGHLISEFYKDILIDLLGVHSHMMKLEVEWQPSLANIIIFDAHVPRITIVGFRARASSGSKQEYWAKLVNVIKSINQKCNYEPGANQEMSDFLDTFKDAYKDRLQRLPLCPLFWTMDMRMEFICDLWDFVKLSKVKISEKQPLGANPTSWLSILQKDAKLSKLKTIIDNFEKAHGMTQTSSTSRAGMNKEEDATRDFLALVRKSLAHFDNNKGVLQGMGIQNEKDVQMLFEKAFPNHIFAFYQRAGPIENTCREKILPPENKLLKQIFMD